MALAWLGTLAAVMALTDAAPAALVLWPGTLPDDATLLDAGPVHAVIAGAATRDLYAHGALLVLPWGLAGCFPSRG